MSSQEPEAAAAATRSPGVIDEAPPGSGTDRLPITASTMQIDKRAQGPNAGRPGIGLARTMYLLRLGPEYIWRATARPRSVGFGAGRLRRRAGYGALSGPEIP